jgi:hypothetical protein
LSSETTLAALAETQEALEEEKEQDGKRGVKRARRSEASEELEEEKRSQERSKGRATGAHHEHRARAICALPFFKAVIKSFTPSTTASILQLKQVA